MTIKSNKHAVLYIQEKKINDLKKEINSLKKQLKQARDTERNMTEEIELVKDEEPMFYLSNKWVTESDGSEAWAIIKRHVYEIGFKDKKEAEERLRILLRAVS